MPGGIWSADRHIPLLRWEGNLQLSQIESVVSASVSPSGHGCIWYANKKATQKVWKVNQTGSTITSWAAPGAATEGLTVNKDGCIWASDNSIDKITKYNQSGSAITSFSTPGTLPTGLTIADDGCLWNNDYIDDKTYKLNQTGSAISSFATPVDRPSGLTINKAGCLWMSTLTGPKIYKINQSGSAISSFDYGQGGLTIDTNATLWNARNIIKDPGEIHHIGLTGSLISSFTSASLSAGIGIDDRLN